MLNAHDSHAQSTKIENVAKQSIRTTKTTTELKNLPLSLSMLKSEYPWKRFLGNILQWIPKKYDKEINNNKINKINQLFWKICKKAVEK